MTPLEQFTQNALGYADRALELGNLSAVDLLVQGILAVDPNNARARELLNVLTTRLRLSQAGGLWRQDGPQAPERYMLIKAWGYGYWADVCHVLGALLVADITGRIPIVYWGDNSRFRGARGDAWQLQWRPVSSATLDDVRRAAAGGIFPGKWTLDNLLLENLGKWDGPQSRLGGIYYLNRPEAVVVSDFFMGIVDLVGWIPRGHALYGKSLPEVHAWLVARYLTPCDVVAERIEAFRSQHLAGHDALAVHVRGSDKITESAAIDQINAETVALMDAEPPGSTLFILTDDARQLEFMRERYGDRVISTVSQRATGLVGLPFQRDEEVDRVALGHEVMVDTYLAMACDRFLGNGRSNVSNIVALFKTWPPGACRILEPLMLLERNFSIYLREAELKV